MLEALAFIVAVAAAVAFSPRTRPAGAFPWVQRGLHGTDFAAGGAMFVLAPITYFAAHTPAWPLAWLTGAVAAWSLWVWLVTAWRR